MKCLRGPSFRDLEFKRLKGLIIPWLDLEKDRSAFSVKSLEYKKEVFFNDTPLKLRVDRIDEIDGNFFIIDYKSGISSKNDWQRTPLTSIQLPLYSLALNEEIIGFANAQVRSNQHKFVGLSKDKRFPGDVISEKSWSVLRESWHTVFCQEGFCQLESKLPNCLERQLELDNLFLLIFQLAFVPIHSLQMDQILVFQQ